MIIESKSQEGKPGKYFRSEECYCIGVCARTMMNGWRDEKPFQKSRTAEFRFEVLLFALQLSERNITDGYLVVWAVKLSTEPKPNVQIQFNRGRYQTI